MPEDDFKIELEKDMEQEISREQAKELLDFIEKKWDDLIYNSRNGAQEISDDPDKILYLPNDYIVPGKGKFNVMFYWDSYFIIQGLKTEENRQELIKGIVDNCLYEVEKYSKVLNANKARWATRSQLPYLALMIKDVYPLTNIKGAKNGKGKKDSLGNFSNQKSENIGVGVYESSRNEKWLEQAFKTAKKEYNGYWLDSYHLSEIGLSRFYDESGADSVYSHTYKSQSEASWDMSPRFDDKDVHDLAPIDLNCNLYQYEKNFEKFALELGDEKEGAEWRKKAESRKKIIDELMWDEREGFFFDYNFRTAEKKKIKSLAAYQAMFVGLANKEQARKLKDNLKSFQTRYGLAACTKDCEFAYYQWDWPTIWAPLQYICYQGLKNYGYWAEAKKIGAIFVGLVYNNWLRTGKIWEKYNGEKGDLTQISERYPNQSGFGWTNAVVEVFIKERYKM